MILLGEPAVCTHICMCMYIYIYIYIYIYTYICKIHNYTNNIYDVGPRDDL